MKDTYNTIARPGEETLFKDRNSKFFGYAFPVQTEDDVKERLQELQELHPSAGHHCYAYQLGVETKKYRVNDDGEPSNSAGMPIYGQIQSFGLTNVLIVSVRYFGGVKLGVGGLINAYRNSAKLALEASEIVEEIIQVQFQLNFAYDLMNKVMRVIKEKNLQVIYQKMELDCEFVIAVRQREADALQQVLEGIYKLEVARLVP
ncbi:MAG: YigZ family protein [Flavobacteriaceae bacterium]|nr:YigZ family protein [Flavobacteriaceae bacterium]|tara:strand:+ start:40483 stop:41091 length:609 start_codon:yes stop_codon:yes gene_type:complete